MAEVKILPYYCNRGQHLNSCAKQDSSTINLVLDFCNITGNTNLGKPSILTAKATISDFWKRAVDGVNPRQRDCGMAGLPQFGFDMGVPTEVRIRYTELICNDFKSLDA